MTEQTVQARASVAGRLAEDLRVAWKPFVAVLVVGVLAVFYLAGRLDYALYPVGLNFHTCAKNGLGATFCGSDLTTYQQRIRSIAIPPIQPLPGATPAEAQVYQQAEASYCRIDPQGQGC